MTTDQEAFLAFFQSQLGLTQHRLRAALVVLREVPDWQEKLSIALQEPSVLAETSNASQMVNRLVEAFRVGVLSDEEFQRVIEEAQSAVQVK